MSSFLIILLPFPKCWDDSVCHQSEPNPFIFLRKRHRAGGCGSVMECLPSMFKVLNLIPSTKKEAEGGVVWGEVILGVKKRKPTFLRSDTWQSEWPRPPSSVSVFWCFFFFFPQHYHLLSVWLWANYLTYLSSSFFLCKMRLTLINN